MYKIKCLNPISKTGLELLSEKYLLSDESQEINGYLIRSMDIQNMEFSKNLEVIARAGAGVNNIPITRCSEQGIVVFNTPGANANGVKELVMAGLLLASRDIIGGINFVKENKHQEDINKLIEKQKSKFAGSELQGKKLGVIGLGSIGVLVANAANNLNMDVYGFDPFISIDNAWSLSKHITRLKSIEEMFEVCDYLTIHIPLLDSTKEMFNKEAFSKMKDNVVILNFARDSLVNDDDLKEALESKKVKSYVTDFPNYKTANIEGVITIPHLGASTEESEENCAKMAVKQMMNYLENGNIINSVNYPTCDAGLCTSAGRVTILHKNVRNMINQFTTVFNKKDVNIENMYNKSKGEYAYTLFDIDVTSTEELKKELELINEVIRVRIIR